MVLRAILVTYIGTGNKMPRANGSLIRIISTSTREAQLCRCRPEPVIREAMNLRILSALFCLSLACGGCSAEPMKYTFQLADRQIRVVGFNPATGEMKTEPTYKSNEVYAVPARVTRVVMKKPGNSGLSGRVDYQLSVQAAPELSPYKKADVFLVTGVPDGTTA